MGFFDKIKDTANQVKEAGTNFDDTDIIIEHGDTVLSITLGEDAEDEKYPRYMYNFIMDILDYE